MAESFNSLYRKYRPSSFDDVAGHKNIVEILRTELKNNNFNHAYLFAGQRGTGKTSVARILAKAINCLDLQDGNPCNKCENCIAFNNGNFADVYEIDAASNNGVDEIRNIKSNVQTLPIVGKYKIYIIDEVHMLSKAAFNALLKTLEEPPMHVVFILATTEYDKIPATIISRCQSFSFKKISNIDMKNRLTFISKNEGFNLADDAANEIYDISEGSLRDALNVLEQLMVVCDQTKNITSEDIKKIFYVATKNEKINVLKEILNNHSQSVIDYFEKAKRQGMDFNVFTLSLIKMIKEIIEYKLTGNENFLDVLNSDDVKQFNNVSVKQLFNVSDNLTEAYIKTKNNNASFDYILLSVLKSIKSGEVISKDVDENEQEEVSEEINGEGDGGPTPETEKVLEEENVVKPVQTNNNENSFDTFEQTTSSVESKQDDEEAEDMTIMFADNEDTVSNDIKDESTNNDSSIDTQTTDEISSDLTNETIQEDNEELSDVEEPEVDDIVESNETIESAELASDPVSLFNKQINLSINDNNGADVSFLINDVINVLMGVLAERNPNLRKELGEKLDSVFATDSKNQFENINEANEFVSLFKATVVAANNNEIIVTTDSQIKADLINKDLTKDNIRNDLMNVLGNDYVVYAITDKEWKSAKNAFADLKTKGLLPTYQPVDNESFYAKNKKVLMPKQSGEDKEVLDKASQLFDLDDLKVSDD